jgi:hypothetical protein
MGTLTCLHPMGTLTCLHPMGTLTCLHPMGTLTCLHSPLPVFALKKSNPQVEFLKLDYSSYHHVTEWRQRLHVRDSFRSAHADFWPLMRLFCA